MPVLGEIAKKAQERMPATWTALAGREDFGEDGLQGRVDATKQELFGTVADAEDELALYGPLGCDYAGVAVALRLIAPGYDHWMSTAYQWGAQGRNETKVFLEDRAAALLRLRDQVLIPEEQRLYPMVADLLVGVIVPRHASVMLSRQPQDEGHVTPDPLTFEPAFERPRSV
jgi:hypothetical protein